MINLIGGKFMKRIKSILIILAMSTLLISCNSKEKDTKVEETKQEVTLETENQVNETEVIYLVGDYDLTVTLSTNDGWKTAELVDNSEKLHVLNQKETEEGIYLANDEGVSIRLKEGKGTLILNNGNEINVEEFIPE